MPSYSVGQYGGIYRVTFLTILRQHFLMIGCLVYARQYINVGIRQIIRQDQEIIDNLLSRVIFCSVTVARVGVVERGVPI